MGLILALATACGAESGGRESTTQASSIGSISTTTPGGSEGIGSATEDETAEASGSESLEASGPDGSGEGTPLFDIGGEEGTGVPPDAGCQRVDFLFVIDNSVSMEDQQQALVGAFPGFIDAIQNTIEADSDYHIMVADTDPWGRCNTVNGFMGIDPSSDTCNNYIKTTAFEECDAVRGAGVDHPAGAFASNMPCNFTGGNRYIVPEEPDISAAFSCAAQVGTAGNSSERPMEGMIAALSPELNAAGECNAGFLRDDALLVIAFISDDPNREDTGMPDEWYQAVVDAKLGDPSAVVVMGLTPAWMGCGGGGDPNGEHWKEFIELWGDHGVHGNVCGSAMEYIDFFQSAVSVIDQACDDYQPPG